MNMKHGVTGPLSTKKSTEVEIKYSAEIEQFLIASNFFENESESIARERALGHLGHLIKKYCNGVLYTFGSYRLGVHQKGADIDTLVVAPRAYSRADFFNKFYDVLSGIPFVKCLSKVEDCYVPLIKMEYMGFLVDMVFCSLNYDNVEEIGLQNATILRNLDDKCIISVNGSRVTDGILSLVPDKSIFHKTLRFIKLWAKKRGIYGNSYGYFGGVAFALCVARICQLYPNKSEFVIIHKFFEIFSKWKWGHSNPVVLKEIADEGQNLRIWDPKNYYNDRYHKMPVITPAYPSMCSTHNVGISTMNLILEEFKLAHNKFSNFLKTSDSNKIVDNNELPKMLSDVTAVSDFFARYKTYLQISISDESSWQGYIESKLRLLVSKIENNEGTLCFLYPKAFNFSGLVYFFGAIQTNVKKINIETQVIDFTCAIKNWDRYVEDCMNINFSVLKRKDMGVFLRNYYEHQSKHENEVNKIATSTSPEEMIESSKKLKIN